MIAIDAAPQTPSASAVAFACAAAAGELANDPHVHDLVACFLRTPIYQRSFCADLLELARARDTYAWELRRLAVLMLEHQILKLRLDDSTGDRATDAEILFLLRALDIIPPFNREDAARVSDARTRFVRLRQRIQRLERVHAAIDGIDTSADALADFFQASRTDCRLTLARYLFTVDEVVARIAAQLDTSTGRNDIVALDQPCVRGEIARSLEQLPPYEAAILRALCRRSTIYWVKGDTSSRINSIVEYPLNTVAVVIKPPGSDLEIEVKRVGMRDAHRWHVVYSRNGTEVPPTHRLQGGSMGYYARWEAQSAASLARVYRLIHDVDPPISRSVGVSSIYGVPASLHTPGDLNGRERHVVDFFTRLEGPFGREETRRAMQRSVVAYCREMKTTALPMHSDGELAAQFLGQVAPTQAILIGTSSFRLDRLVAHLAPDGTDRYFAGLARAESRAEAKAFTDEILEEVLGVVTTHDSPYDTHAQYVDAIFARPENRTRADRQYRRAMRQIGAFWGTLLGMRAYTYGESFVARNVGLKSVWRDGEWMTTILFMDHDGTYVSGQRAKDFHPLSALPGMQGDEMHIWGVRNVTGEVITGDVALLRTLYRIDDRVERGAQSLLREELQHTFRHTRRTIHEDVHVRGCFSTDFIERFDDWDEIVASFLAIGEDPAARDAWRARTSQWLDNKGYPDTLRREYLRAVERHERFLRRLADLY